MRFVKTVFSINPTSLTLGTVLLVVILCLFGTPILDLKPYFPDFDAAAHATLPEWVSRLMRGYF